MKYRGLIGCAGCKAYLPFALKTSGEQATAELRATLATLGWEWLTATPDDGEPVCGYWCPRHVEEIKAREW